MSYAARVEIPSRAIRERPVWYQLMYNLAAHQAHLAMAFHLRSRVPIIQRGAPSFVGDARETASVLVVAAGDTLSELADITRKRRFWERAQPDRLLQLNDFLEASMEPAAAILLAGLTSTADSAWSDPYGHESNQGPWTRQEVGAALRIFIGDGEIESGLSRGLFHFAVERPRLTYRVNYNVACYLSTTLTKRDDGEVAAAALDALNSALAAAPNSDRRNLTTWARKDPSLEALRVRRKDDFDELIDFYSGPSLERRQPLKA